MAAQDRVQGRAHYSAILQEKQFSGRNFDLVYTAHRRLSQAFSLPISMAANRRCAAGYYESIFDIAGMPAYGLYLKSCMFPGVLGEGFE